MGVSFHQLHIFYTVASRGSFSAAAQVLHMTQPAVTMQIQSLEDYFGSKLFHRSTKKLQLSDAGRTLLPYARRSLDLVQETEQAMVSFTKELHGKLQLGASLTIGEYVLPHLLGKFGVEHPQTSLSMRVMNTTQIMEGIRAHRLDLGLVEAPVIDGDMVVEAVMEDEMMLIVPAGHHLAGKEQVSLQDALACSYVLREEGSGTRKVMEDALQQQGVDLRSLQVVMELGSTGAVKSAVEAGLGVTMLSPSAVRHERQLGLVKALRVNGLSLRRQFYVVHRKEGVLAWPAAAFLNFLRQHREKERE
ncbi:selenium metabolism-associated LysR family transcriptional regulator [Paenibacillus taiwanensis]|uniref:selenium metabolism-associated LysR family transcriptional regulator n=1 Tax=Paenibacillus taiwanensis TaxID=401638 RepID=UPI00041D1EB0|nr:selenium metabolism-associated LysR family transcriptional regulator [Paenibacillus taiwanensis]